VTREPEQAYRNRHPGAADVILLAEIADSTYDFDVKRKARIYATAGFPEYLVLDLTEPQLLVFRDPRGGAYRQIQVLRRGDIFYALAAPESGIAVSELLPE
jgi:Uma2 family endonuclease